MAEIKTLAEYIEGFFSIGSKATVKKNKKELLERLISYEAQDLETTEQVQALENLGISTDMFGKSDRRYMRKGLQIVTFLIPFNDPYTVIATGLSGRAKVNVIVKDDSNLGYFTIQIPSDCVVRWQAKLMTETVEVE